MTDYVGEKMRILVTGGAGFIGSHLCERLAKEHNVICVDNLLTGKRENLEGMAIRFIRHDIARPFEKKIGKVDVIFNLASPASPADYEEYPIETLLANSVGVYNMLEIARKNDARFLQASSSEVYGDPLIHPQREGYWGNANPIGPRSCYDEGKRFAEALCMSYYRKYGLGVAIARIFNTYGPRMRLDDGRVVPNFISQALKNRPITVYGDGKQTRSFCYVSDMVNGLCALAFSKYKGEVFNVGNPEEHTILEFANITKRKCSSDSRTIFKSLPRDDPRKRKPDVSKITKAVGWKPKVSLDEGLGETVGWFRKRLRK